MPPLTRWMIKASLAYLVAALLVAAAQAASPLLGRPPFLGALGPVYFHLFLVGWVSQLIFGVVFWMFPKFSPAQPRGNERLGWWTFGLLNAGLLLRALAEPLNSLNPGTVWGWGLALSALLQWLAGMAFVGNTWPRVKEK